MPYIENTGTWADVIRVPLEIVHGAPVAAPEKLALFAQAIRDKRFDEYLLFRPTFAQLLFYRATARWQRASMTTNLEWCRRCD